jgi:hypothetical protein
MQKIFNAIKKTVLENIHVSAANSKIYERILIQKTMT